MLVCDHESLSLRALRVVLRGAGFEVDETSTARQALERAALRAPDAAIIELVLPDGDGVEVCRRLREGSAIPVIMQSAIGEEEQKVRALEAGADDYVTKPFGPRELIARLHAAAAMISAPWSWSTRRSTSQRAPCAARGRRSTLRRSNSGCWAR